VSKSKLFKGSLMIQEEEMRMKKAASNQLINKL